jgi:hypothetical protein
MREGGRGREEGGREGGREERERQAAAMQKRTRAHILDKKIK